MAFSAARPYAGPVFNLNERPQVKVARMSSLNCPKLSLVHAFVPQQFIGQKLHLHCVALKRRGRHSQVVRASRGQGSIRRSQPGDAVPGDPNLQNELVDMLRLEVAKAQMSMFCDAEADKLREIAAEGLKELDRKYQSTITNSINEVDAEGERALRELDASTARFRRRMEESKAQAEASARDSELLEQSIFEARNERLFFKNLYTPAKAKLPRTAAQTQQLQQELKAIRDVTSDSFSSGYRKLLYGALSIVMTSALWSTASAFTAGNPIRWSKVVIYIAILGAIFMQFWFENSQSSDSQTSGSDADASDAANKK